MMYGEDSMPSGTLGVVYEGDGDRPNDVEVLKIMQKYSNIISQLLENKVEPKRGLFKTQ